MILGSYCDLCHISRRVRRQFYALFGVVLINSSAIGISIGENILVGKLIDEVPKYASAIPPQAVVDSGALNLQTITSYPAVLYGLRQAYGVAISAIMICATVTICVSILATLGMQRLNLKVISREREVKEQTNRFAASNSDFVAYGEQADDLALLNLKS